MSRHHYDISLFKVIEVEIPDDMDPESDEAHEIAEQTFANLYPDFSGIESAGWLEEVECP